MMMESLAEKVEALIMPFLGALDVELVDLNIRRYHSQLTVQVLADKKNGGITIAQCAQLNRQIGDAIEVENLISGHYVVEVASPGLDRPLKTAKDFLRVVGREVRFYLSEPVDNKIEHSGFIKNADSDNVTIEVKTSQLTIPLNKINKAIQII